MAGFNWFNRRVEKQEEPPKPAEEQSPVEAKATEEPSTDGAPTVNQDYLSWAKAAYQNIKQQQALTIDTSAATETPEPVAEPEPEPAIETETPATIAPEPTATAEAEVEAIIPVEESTEAAIAPPVEEPVTEPEPEVIAEEAVAAIAPPVEEPVTEPEPEVVEEESVEAIAPVEEPAIEPPVVIEEPGEVMSEPVAEVSPVEPVAEIPTPAISEPEPVTETASPEPAPALPFWAQAEADRLERLERLKAEAFEEPEPEPVQTTAQTESAVEDELVLDEGFLWSAEVLAAQGRRPDEVSIEEITWLKRLRQGLDKTRRGLIYQLRSVVGQGPLNQDAVMEIESLLLQADVGIEATDYIVESLQNKLREETLPPNEAIAYLKSLLRDMLEKPFTETYSPTFAPEKDTLNIWLITGVNGAGKTTTIGKIAHLAQKSDYRCLIAAADTFRAAAVEQVKVWGQRSNVEVIANPGKNTDPAAVVFDAIAAAKSRNTELLLVDTAGRLQNKKNLMEELSKIRRIIDKKAPDAHIESLLVLDSTLGQNGLRQAEVFAEAANLSGVVLTKLDGTARGGIALAVVQQLGLPIRFLGAGEGIEDLRPFSSYEFVEALLS